MDWLFPDKGGPPERSLLKRHGGYPPCLLTFTYSVFIASSALSFIALLAG